MQKIILTGPNTRNDGSYADAGTELTVGDKADQISADRTKSLLDGHGRAEKVSAAAKD